MIQLVVHFKKPYADDEDLIKLSVTERDEKFQNCLTLLYVERGRVRWIKKRMKYKESIGSK